MTKYLDTNNVTPKLSEYTHGCCESPDKRSKPCDCSPISRRFAITAPKTESRRLSEKVSALLGGGTNGHNRDKRLT